MGLLHVIALAATLPQPPQVKAQARASIRIVQQGKASARDWQTAIRRTERRSRDAQGRELILRTIDFE